MLMGEEEISKDELFESPVLLWLKASDIWAFYMLIFLSFAIYDPELELCPNWTRWTTEQHQVK